MKVEHIGIAVRDLEQSNTLFTALFGQPPYKEETVESEHVRTSFFQQGETKIELLQATAESSAIHKFIEKRGEGMHHIAFEVPDIHAAMER
ncbi:MAG: VOC family protein, partial [Bacteroidota bacterium]